MSLSLEIADNTRPTPAMPQARQVELGFQVGDPARRGSDLRGELLQADIYFGPALGCEHIDAEPNSTILRAIQDQFPASAPPTLIHYGVDQLEGRADCEDSMRHRSYWERILIVTAIMRKSWETALRGGNLGVFIGHSFSGNIFIIAQALLYKQLQEEAKRGESGAEIMLQFLLKNAFPRVLQLNPAVSAFDYVPTQEANAPYFYYKPEKGYEREGPRTTLPGEVVTMLKRQLTLPDDAPGQEDLQDHAIWSCRMGAQWEGGQFFDLESYARNFTVFEPTLGVPVGMGYTNIVINDAPVTRSGLKEHLLTTDHHGQIDARRKQVRYAIARFQSQILSPENFTFFR